MCKIMFKEAAQATAIVDIAQQGRESLGPSVFRASTAVFSDKDRLDRAPGVVFGDSDPYVAHSVVDIVPNVRHVGVDHVPNVDNSIVNVGLAVADEPGNVVFPSIVGLDADCERSRMKSSSPCVYY